MYHRFLSLLMALLLISVCFDASGKAHKLMPTIKFEGKLEKKAPNGQGTLIIEKRHGDKFEIHGFFEGDTIRNAVCQMGGLILKGTFTYNLEKNDGSGIYALRFTICKGEYNNYAIENFGPITVQNTYRDDSGRGKLYRELKETKIYGEGLITSNTLKDNQDRLIPSYNIQEATQKVIIGYKDHEWDRRSREYYTAYEATSSPIKVKYNNGVELEISPEGDAYIVKSSSGNNLTFSKYGEIKKNSTVNLKDRSRLTILDCTRPAKLELVYADGSKYIGTIKGMDPENFALPNIINYLPTLEITNATSFSPHTGKIYYSTLALSDGPSIDEFINGEKKSIIDARKKKEEEDKEKAYAERQTKKREKEQAQYNKWVSQYGAKAAKAIKDNKPYIGMSEAAFKHISGYSLREESGNSRVYVNYGNFYGNIWNGGYDPDAIYCIVVCSGGKIVRITKP